MLFFFRPKPLIDDASCDWLFDTFYWALTEFDSDEFFQRTQLILPTNAFFPGNISSREEMARRLFSATVGYAGLQHWPWQLQAPQDFVNQMPALLQLPALQRNSSNALLPVQAGVAGVLTLSYNPQQASKPGDMVATYAHNLAQHLLVQGQSLPPGGRDYFAAGAEVMAVVMGFGVLLANSAYTFRGGCGSCYNAQANREANLSEDNLVFALALFCRLKGIPTRQATAHLKRYLRGSFKQALAQIDRQSQQLQRLMALR